VTPVLAVWLHPRRTVRRIQAQEDMLTELIAVIVSVTGRRPRPRNGLRVVAGDASGSSNGLAGEGRCSHVRKARSLVDL
jgi:hypothetical protein